MGNMEVQPNELASSELLHLGTFEVILWTAAIVQKGIVAAFHPVLTKDTIGLLACVCFVSPGL